MSTQSRIYLDFNATAPLLDAARAAMVDAMAASGNPSSIHAEGRRARDRVERARRAVAQLVHRPYDQLVFTSGGTEANMLGVMAHARRIDPPPHSLGGSAVTLGNPRRVTHPGDPWKSPTTLGSPRRGKGGGAGVIEASAIDGQAGGGDARQGSAIGGVRRAYVARIDHPSLVGAVVALRERGWEVIELEVSGDGEVRLPPPDKPFGLLAMAAVNHELGTTANVEQLYEFMSAARDRAAGRPVRLHVDAVQAAGKLDLGAWSWVDSMAISAHKLGGPQGIGALAITDDGGLPPVASGHQERGRRPGTENTLGIVGFGAAAALADPSAWPRVAALGERLEAGLRALPGVRIHGGASSRIGGTINAGFAGARGESIVMALDLEGIAVSTGAACTSGSVQASPVLLGLGLTANEAREAVRFSLGRSTTETDVDAVLGAVPRILERVRRYQ